MKTPKTKKYVIHVLNEQKNGYTPVTVKQQEQGYQEFVKSWGEFQARTDYENRGMEIVKNSILEPSEIKELTYWENDMGGLDALLCKIADTQSGFINPCSMKRPTATDVED